MKVSNCQTCDQPMSTAPEKLNLDSGGDCEVVCLDMVTKMQLMLLEKLRKKLMCVDIHTIPAKLNLSYKTKVELPMTILTVLVRYILGEHYAYTENKKSFDASKIDAYVNSKLFIYHSRAIFFISLMLKLMWEIGNSLCPKRKTLNFTERRLYRCNWSSHSIK